jgi:hypothetical protein
MQEMGWINLILRAKGNAPSLMRAISFLILCTSNADPNGAINIGRKFERHLCYAPSCGVACEPTLNGTSDCGSHLTCYVAVHLMTYGKVIMEQKTKSLS